MNQENIAASQPASPKKHTRSVRNILIHKPMQREFSFVMIALLMISTFAVGWVVHHTIYDAAFGPTGYQFGKVSPSEVLSDVSYQLMVRVSGILFATIIVIVVFGIFFLHRVAGPVYKFQRTFLRLNDGEIPGPVRLREGDFFSETASEINRIIKRTQFEHEKLKKIRQKLESIVAAGTGQPFYKEAKELKTVVEEEWHEGE